MSSHFQWRWDVGSHPGKPWEGLERFMTLAGVQRWLGGLPISRGFPVHNHSIIFNMLQTYIPFLGKKTSRVVAGSPCQSYVPWQVFKKQACSNFSRWRIPQPFDISWRLTIHSMMLGSVEGGTTLVDPGKDSIVIGDFRDCFAVTQLTNHRNPKSDWLLASKNYRTG